MRLHVSAHVVAALIVAVPVAWLAGEQHRANCMRAGRSGCSVLPWDRGTTASAPVDPALQREAEAILREQREAADREP